jgi:hypothetical protein
MFLFFLSRDIPPATSVTHEKSNMKRTLIAGMAAGTILAGTTAGVAAASPAEPKAALSSAHHPVNWTQRTCAAFSTYEHHKSTANLITMLIDSTHVPFKYLGQDVAQLYIDTRTGTKYADDDRQYAFSDCHNGYGL